MKLWILGFSLLLFMSCKKNQPVPQPVDNAVTRYADNLKSDVEKARDAVDIANEKIKQTEQQLNNSVQH